MSKGKRLTFYERGQIDAFKLQNLSFAQISRLIKRSKNVVHNYLRLKENYGLKGKRGRKKSFSKRTVNAIYRYAKGKIISAKTITKDLQLTTSVRTTQRILANCPTLLLTKYMQKPKLTKEHKMVRKEICQKWLIEHFDWKKTIFSDEKKFNFMLFIDMLRVK